MGKLVMGYWDCPFCGSKEIRGDVMNCPSCGRARGDVRFYMKDYTEGEIREENERADIEYVEEKKAQEMSRNPDWYCSFCNSLNSDNVQTCGVCGASRADSESNYFDQLKKKQEKEAAEAAAQQPAQPEKRSRKGLLFLLLLVPLALLIYFMVPKTAKGLQVTEVGWQRVIQIQASETVSHSGYSLPSDAELTRQEQETYYVQVIDHYETRYVERTRRVVDHYETYYTYEDRGNGSFEEVAHQRPVYKDETYTEPVQQPVYRNEARLRTKYYYTQLEWKNARSVTASGKDQNPYWPEFTLGENEREGQKAEVYLFAVTDRKGEATAYRVVSSRAESDWLKLSEGMGVQITTASGSTYVSDENGNRIADIRKISTGK